MSDETVSGNLLLLLITPVNNCVPVQLGRVDVKTVEVLKKRDFDDAPVFAVPGTVRTAHLEQLLTSGEPLLPEDPRINRTLLPSDSSLERALEVIAAENAVIVTHNGSPAGLLTLSDLNKHALRGVLYGRFAKLEVDLAKTITRLCPDPWEWIPQLPEDQQVRVIGYWEITKRRNIDIGPLASCTLTQLLKTVVALEKVRKEFGFQSRHAAEDVCGPLPMLRNNVMHPVRPLVTKAKDVEQMVRSIRKLALLTSAVSERTTSTSVGQL